MGVAKSLAETHAIERAKWDSLAPTALAADSRLPTGAGFASPRSPLLSGISGFLGDLRGRRVLEYGCGLGELTMRLARDGAFVTAFDLSPRSIEYVRRRAAANGLEHRVDAQVATAERLPFFDESFERVFGKAILHFLDPELGAPELHRVLRPGGRAAFSEPLGMNPVLNLARSWFPRRWRHEHRPLRQTEIERWMAEFAHSEIRRVQLLSTRYAVLLMTK